MTPLFSPSTEKRLLGPSEEYRRKTKPIKNWKLELHKDDSLAHLWLDVSVNDFAAGNRTSKKKKRVREM